MVQYKNNISQPRRRILPVVPVGSNMSNPVPNTISVGHADDGVSSGRKHFESEKVDLSYNANAERDGFLNTSYAPSLPPHPPVRYTPEETSGIYDDEIVSLDTENNQIAEEINSGGNSDASSTASEGTASTSNTAETIKDTAYTYADEILMKTLGFNKEQYNAILAEINAARDSGLKYAADTKTLLLSLADDTKRALYAAAEAAREREFERADIARERGIVDANSAYAQNKASYGANAETLGAMGLTGSGYSDYVNAQAYATQRGEVQSANANAERSKRDALYAEDEKKRAADMTYRENVAKAEGEYADTVYKIDSTYNDNFAKINSDKAAADFEANIANQNAKFEADQTYASNLLAAEDREKTLAANEAELLASLGDNVGAIRASVKSGSISSSAGEAAIKQIQDSNFESYMTDIKAGIADPTEIEKAAGRDEISSEQLASLKKEWSNSFVRTVDFFKNSGSLIMPRDAKKKLEDITGSPWCDSSTKAQLETIYKNMYLPKSQVNGLGVNIKVLEKSGKNFKVKVGGKEYRVESRGICTNQFINELADNVGTGRMFKYDGKIYIKRQEKVYEIGQRNSAKNDWMLLSSTFRIL